MPLRRLLILPLSLLAAPLLAVPTSVAHADDAGGGPDENIDVATPTEPPGDSRPAVRGTTPEPRTQVGELTILAESTLATRVDIDDFSYDRLELEGTAREVCAGRILDGTLWAFYEVTGRFGGSAGTMYVCRERWDAANDPDCNGTVVNPATNPSFHSTCWSNHAKGRAFDVMVGRSGSGYNTWRGIQIVNWLLASDQHGNVNANARKLGVQQLLFADRCWNSDGDRGLASWSELRQCGIGHHDHVHADMTIAGSNGNVSYWGATPQVSARIDTQVFWDINSDWRQAVSWWNTRATDEEGLTLGKYDRMYVGDFDADGLEDETFLFDLQTGDWAVKNWNDGDALTARIGNWRGGFDWFVVGDFNRDGYTNDLFAWNRSTGRWGLHSFNNYEPRGRNNGYWSTGYEQAIAADLNGDGFVNDTMLWDRHTGKWVAFSWQGFRSTYRAMGYFGTATDTITVGDFSAGGDRDELLLWDRNHGNYIVQHWEHWRPRTKHPGRGWSVTFDRTVAFDYDSDGRRDDLFLYDTATGRWTIYSFHRNVGTFRTREVWLGGYDIIIAGSFLN